MRLFEHDHIIETAVEIEPIPDGTVFNVLVVDTNLPLIAGVEGYDEDALTEMVMAIQSFMREHTNFHRARIRYVG
jgi:hypothetical protein